MTRQAKNLRWLNGELQRWVSQGIIDNTRAEAIRRLYPEEKAVRPWALIVFSGIGGVITGLGVILLFAYNWQDMPKFAKLAVVFIAIVAAHGVGLWLFFRSARFRGLGEAFVVLGTMFFGAGIWLVAQIYHIEEHFPNAFFLWGLGALALAWALPSLAQAILAAVLFTIWAGTEAIAFGGPAHLALPIILLLGLLAYIRRSRVLLAILILAFGFSTGFVASACIDNVALINVLLSLSAIYVSLGLLSRRYGRFPQSSAVLHIFGFVAYIMMLYLLSFPDMAREILAAKVTLNTGSVLYLAGPLALALAAWMLVVLFFLPWSRRTQLTHCPYDLFLVPLVLILCYCFLFFPRGFNRWAAAGPLNLVLLAHAGSMMARGCREGRLGPTVCGSLMLVALTVARYVDLFESLAARGVVFIVVGIILFAQGIYYVRSKKKQVPMEVA